MMETKMAQAQVKEQKDKEKQADVAGIPQEADFERLRQSIAAQADYGAVKNLKGHVSDAEWQARAHLAALYRLASWHGWDDNIATHISHRVPDEPTHFLINPWGMLFGEITASSLVKIDLSGQPVHKTPYIVNPAGFTIHSAIHRARANAHCVMHLHTDSGIAVSAQRDGLLPISQHALICFKRLTYHDYEGIALNEDEQTRIIADLGDKPLMILRNHGTLAVGEDCGTTYQAMLYLEKACCIQIQAQNSQNLIHCTDEQIELTHQQSEGIFNGLAGALAWPGMLRLLDRLDNSFRD